MSRAETAPQPRAVIVVQSDQHRFDCVGHTGHPNVETPHLDRLAREGATFRHAYTPVPCCVPSRTSFLSGQWAAQHGVLHNWDAPAPRLLDPKQPTWARSIRGTGRRTDYIGRWHVHPQLDATHFGFDTHLSDHRYAAWRASQDLPPQEGIHQSGTEDLLGFLGATDADITPEQSQPAWLMDQVIEMLEARSREPNPFLIRMDCLQPHLPCRPPEPYASMYSPEAIEPWGSFGDTFAGKPYIQAQQLRNWGIEDMTWNDWAPVVGRYLGEISLIDTQIGRLMDELERLGLADDTLLIYTSDHGDLCGGHRMIDKHFVIYDEVVRVPLVMRWPNGYAGGQVREVFVSNVIDLASTLCSVSGAEISDTFSGRDLLLLLRGEAGDERKDIFSAYDGNQFGRFSQRMVRDRRWKYIWNLTAGDELYQMEANPHELVNRATDVSCQHVLQDMRRRMAAWLTETNDPYNKPWVMNALLAGRKI